MTLQKPFLAFVLFAVIAGSFAHEMCSFEPQESEPSGEPGRVQKIQIGVLIYEFEYQSHKRERAGQSCRCYGLRNIPSQGNITSVGWVRKDEEGEIDETYVTVTTLTECESDDCEWLVGVDDCLEGRLEIHDSTINHGAMGISDSDDVKAYAPVAAVEEPLSPLSTRVYGVVEDDFGEQIIVEVRFESFIDFPGQWLLVRVVQSPRPVRIDWELPSPISGLYLDEGEEETIELLLPADDVLINGATIMEVFALATVTIDDLIVISTSTPIHGLRDN